ncbi:hypothetical protein [Roseateles sp. MS654]|uniref:hypothetical protein n=1 Tax=Roseateles sp. MS654 TaxID=3412685 RepID=UPI003C2C9825
MPDAKKTRLTNTVTVAQYQALEAADDRAACGRFIVQRFHERYFEPTVNAPTRHGFTLMAIGCLVIEALECFYEGKAHSKDGSAKMFAAFFQRPTGLEAFGQGDKDWFFKDIRCAVLHQAETVGGWRLRRNGKLLDPGERVINAKRFVELLQRAVGDYAKQLETDQVLWRNFKKKMQAVCTNCEAPV